MSGTGFELETASETNTGRVRKQNQDSFGEFVAKSGTRLLVVADGMGGHRGGEVASATAIESLGCAFEAGVDEPVAFLTRAFSRANEDILQRSSDNPELVHMGTTCVALLVLPNGRAFVANVGDSRAYRFRDGELRTITEDHSWVAEQVRAGRLSEAEAEGHPRRNVLLRCLGVRSGIEIDIDEIELEPGDQILLCSDGLWGTVPPWDIVEVLDRDDPERAVRKLIGLANQRGGPDNITAQIARLPVDFGTTVEQRAAQKAAASRRRWLGALAAVALVAGMLLLARSADPMPSSEDRTPIRPEHAQER